MGIFFSVYFYFITIVIHTYCLFSSLLVYFITLIICCLHCLYFLYWKLLTPRQIPWTWTGKTVRFSACVFFFLTYILGSISWSWEQCWWMWLWKWTDVISVILMSRQNDPASILCSPWYEMIMNWFLSRWISRTLPLSEILLSCSHFPTQKEIIRKMSAVYNTQIMSYISVLPCNCCLDLYFLWHVLNGYICLQWEQN